MFRKFMLIIVMPAMLFCIGFASPKISAQDAGTGGVGGRPAYPRDDNQRSQSIFVHTIDTGNSVTDGVNIINNSNDEKIIAIYATDSVVSSGGAFACKQEVEDKFDVGSWINLSRNTITLQPAESEVIDFSITVPEFTDVGEHNGCIVIQEQTGQNVNPEQGIGLSFRSAIRVAVLVPGDIVKALTVNSLDILIGAVEVGKDTVTVVPVLENKGNVSLDVQVDTELRYWPGIKASNNGGQFPVLRGEKAEFNLEHPRPFWGGFMQAILDVQYNDNPSEFVGESSENNAQLGAISGWVFVPPHILALLVYAAVLVILFVIFQKIISKLLLSRDIRQNWLAHTVGSDENIKDIAAKYGISWKKLAKANGLKPPYAVQKGDKLKTPREKK